MAPCRYNFRGFDIGNHFNEWAGFDCDWSACPTAAEQRHFLREYLPAGTGDAEVEAARREAELYAMASHLYWGLWGVIQARHSSIDFDYLGYSKRRFDRYRQLRADEELEEAIPLHDASEL